MANQLLVLKQDLTAGHQMN
uniref:Uncharacterized protein n=1 Tax=Arundo donax TaxID=35708 RepID=A0A0A9A7X3_ARUDO